MLQDLPPILSNVATEFLNGTGAYSTPVAGGSGVDSFETLASPQGLQGIEQLRHNVASYQNYGNVIVDGLQDQTGISGTYQVTYTGSSSYQYALTSSGYTQIAQGNGTAFGDIDYLGSLARIFDGNTDQTFVNSRTPGNGPGYAGKNWGAGTTYTLTQFKTYGSNDSGYDGQGAGGTTISIFLYGSNSAPANGTNGTLLYTATPFADTTGTDPHTYNTGIVTTTAYRYHWVYITTSAAEGVGFAELEFFYTPSISSGFVHTLAYPMPTVPTHLGVSVKLDSAFTSDQHTYLKVDVSRDGGTTFTDCHPIVKVGTDGYYRADMETITAQPSGSTALAKVTLAGSTTKALKGVSIYGE